MAEETWIGKVEWPDGVVATLGAGGVWECDNEVRKLYLDRMFDPRTSDLPRPWMPRNRTAVSQAAAELGGTATFRVPLEPLPEGELS